MAVEFLWATLTPFLWLWQVLWFVLVRPWAVSVLVAVVSTAYLAIRHRRSQAQVCLPPTHFHSRSSVVPEYVLWLYGLKDLVSTHPFCKSNLAKAELIMRSTGLAKLPAMVRAKPLSSCQLQLCP